jgi:hypothetical protein
LTNAKLGSFIGNFSSQRLEVFDLRKGRQLNSALGQLSRMARLRHLDLRDNDISDGTAKKILKGCKRLVYLNMAGTILQDDGALAIAKSKKLEFLGTVASILSPL